MEGVGWLDLLFAPGLPPRRILTLLALIRARLVCPIGVRCFRLAHLLLACLLGLGLASLRGVANARKPTILISKATNDALGVNLWLLFLVLHSHRIYNLIEFEFVIF